MAVPMRKGVALVVFAVTLCLASGALALNNGLGRTPQMGFNTWNRFFCDVNETLVRESIDALVESGLAAAGYKYMNVDDCWAGWRDDKGFIHPDNKTFPNGMRALADYAHSRGLLFGLYSDAGEMTCAKRPGSLGYEKNDAMSYAAWNVDYLKYDNCYNKNIPPRQRYPIMRDALNATGRKIFYSLCEWGVDDPATWAGEVGNSWRTTPDIEPSWERITSRIDLNDPWWKYAGPGGWNDPDMLEVGNGQLTIEEQKSHFSLWALSKAPLLIGCDVRNLSPQVKQILTAPEVIAINQDSLGVQGHKVWIGNSTSGAIEVWAGPLANGDVAAIAFNRGSQTNDIHVRWTDIGLPSGKRATVRDIWARKDVGTYNNGFTVNVPSHGVFFARIRTV